MPSYPPTSEQVRAVDLFKTGTSLKINAFAGTGKTTTLEYLAASNQKQGIYLAFNKSIAAEASGRFPPSVQCRTTHSLAYRATAPLYGSDQAQMTHDVNANAIAELLNLNDLIIGSNFVLNKRSRGALIRQTLKRFQHSGDAVISTPPLCQRE
jgi:hypothetical protein